ncbi:phospholipid/cholesterol/gamma-HCH transport system permease protein [Mariprofundus ferrinatatus]|uniref:Phospholipid/cholesterol/gamma-HCH transport system permease protein n=1 Tax=Mariprofundus ferrinatatus TaxID=1921087 RepID=A0A2K8LD35_9PROT|nr:MlaE family lipid ABC transporter permease subunit [Mariprofundus ferrinatatus]ATX82814.1 phospholipid/cholesterol/gamma-HCH transport system permease protein [Mariprofundus ferrinatatus]
MSEISTTTQSGIATFFGRMGRYAMRGIEHLGDGTRLAFHALSLLFAKPWQGKHFVIQLYALGVGSLAIIVITGAFTGMVLALQGYYTLAKFGSESLLGAGVGMSIIRELGPVLGAFMIIGRAGSSITAEIGIMRVTEQTDALEMMAVNPMQRIILPRIIATTLAVPLLVSIFDVVGIGAGYIVGVELLGVNPGAYMAELVAKLEMIDLNGGWVKAVVFGFMIGTICTYMGYRAQPTTEGVAKATTQAVVIASVSVLIIDYILTSFFL